MKTAMLRSILALSVLTFLSTAATADCAAEAEAAERAFVENGPFHFERRTAIGSLFGNLHGAVTFHDPAHICGKVSPLVSDEVFPCEHGPADVTPSVSIGQSFWEKDAFGWVARRGYSGPQHGDQLPLRLQFSPDDIQRYLPPKTLRSDVLCTTDIGADGQRLRKIRSAFPRPLEGERIETIFFELGSSRPTRLEILERQGQNQVFNFSVSYRFDPTIKIKAPVVNAEERKKLSLQAFKQASAEGDQACRLQLVQAIESSAQQPFRFTAFQTGISHGSYWGGVFFTKTRFLIDQWENQSSKGFEIGRAGNLAWIKLPSHLGGGLTSISLTDERLNIFQDTDQGLMISPNWVGRTHCGIAENKITFEEFFSIEGEIHLRETRVASLDAGHRIIRIETKPKISGLLTGFTEIRDYDSTLTITQPKLP